MKQLSYILYLIILMHFSSCGEDRTGEFYALIEDRKWIEDTMREYYLWNEHIPAINNDNDYFAKPTSFFKNLLYKKALDGKGDSYSYMEELEIENKATRNMYLERTSTYGMEFELVKNPLKNSNQTYARILYVLPQSPAEKAGIKRGDWISSIGKDKITTDNYTQLMYGNSASFARDRIVMNEEGNQVWQPVDTVTISASITMEITPFLLDTVYQISDQKIAYMVYNEFSTGPQNNTSETLYHEQMKQIFTRFKSEDPDAFILDLRYNNGGFLSCAQVLGSLLVPSHCLDKDFIKLHFNEKSNPQVVNYTFDSQYSDANLNLNKIYILTSSYTASASEAVINGLKPYMGAENVILIGEKTEGKNVAMSSFKNEQFNLVLWPVVAYVYNADNEGDYTNGITPQYELNERNYIHSWYPLGDERELLLKNTLSLITTGTMPDITTPEETEVQSLISTTSLRNMGSIRIK